MEYKKIVASQKEFFLSDATKNYFFRLSQLKKLKTSIIQNEGEILKALNLDLGKSYGESYLTEVGLVLKEIAYHIKHLKKLMKIKRVRTPLTLFPAKSYIYQEPYGNVLIISPWNYPFLLAINPLIGAIAAGNTAIIKPSEYAPNTAKIIEKLIKNAFDEIYITTILGEIDETTKLLENRFDYLFFTGSPKVGKIMMKKMSYNLTPLTLELGGKSPALITNNVNIALVAKRIAYGKTINAGQTCIAPDYLLIEESLLDDFVKHFNKAIKSFYNDPLNNNDYPKIINNNHHKRLINLINNENIILGGKYNETKIEPTLVLIKDLNTKLMEEEIFGPILPIITYNDINFAYNYIINNEKPLSAYLFTNSKEIKKVFINKISAGGIVINDTLMHFANNNLPFGGVGNSGIGKYHGKNSFLTFSHPKSILNRKNYLDVKLRYHPISNNNLKLIKKIIK